MHRSALAAALALTLVAAACGLPDDAASPTTPPSTPVPTLGGVGKLPDTVPPAREPLVLVTRPPAEPLELDDESEEDDEERDDEPAGREPVTEELQGNRVLVIGDSIMASTSSRYTGAMCAALVPLGWAVAVDAEPGRFVEFGNDVLDDRLAAADVSDTEDFDVAVVHLGSNYRGDQDEYARELEEILTRLAPRPTVLYTVTEYRPEWSEVNDVVRAAARQLDHVTLVDWEAISTLDGVLSGDGLHPGEQGIQILAESVATAIGSVPRSEGECLDSSFRDDTGVGSGPTIPPPSNTSSSSGSSGGTYTPPATTAAPVQTAAPVTTSSPPPPPPTAPPPTAPPPTAPPPTAPPPTAPPPTAPPPTAPPPTAPPEG